MKTTINTMTIDHMRVIRNATYRERCQLKIRAMMPIRGSVTDYNVVHENDHRCCRREAWPITCAHLFGPLVAEVAQTNPDNLIAQWAEHEPSVVFACPTRK